MSRSLVDDVQRSGNRIARNATVLFRLERLIARRRMAVASHRATLLVIACLIGGVGFFMANVAVFFWLATFWGNALTGAALAAVNFVAALVFVWWALRMSAERELEPMVEMRDLVVSEIETDVSDAFAEAGKLTENVRRIATDPLGALAPGLLGPLLAQLMKSAKKS